MRKRWLFTENDEVFVLGQRSSLRNTDSWKGRRHVLSLVILPMVIFIMVLMVLVVLMVLMVMVLIVMMVPMMIFIIIIVIIIVAKTSSPCIHFDDDGASGDFYHHHRHHDCGKSFVTLYSVCGCALPTAVAKAGREVSRR